VQFYKDILINKKLVKKQDIEGVESEVIAKIENEYDLLLPNKYKKFLHLFGKKCGQLFTGDCIYYPELLTIKKNYNEMIFDDSMDFKIPKNAFVFFSYENHTFYYFICDGNDDPIVYSILEGDEKAEVAYASFTRFLIVEIFSLLIK